MSTRAFFELLDGKGAHASTTGCVADLPVHAAVRRLPEFPHSIFDLVFHMNFWMDYDLRRIRGERPPYPEHAGASWPAENVSLSEAQWKRAVEAFNSLLEQVATCMRSDPAELSRPIEPLHAQHEDRDSSLSGVLWQTLVHNSYHVGQIAMLRRMLDLWPPREGGDTW